MASGKVTHAWRKTAAAWKRSGLLTRHLLRNRLRKDEVMLTLLCAPLGFAVGLAVIFLHDAVTWLHAVDFDLPLGTHLSSGHPINPWRLAIVPSLGGAALGLQAIISRLWRPGEIIDPIEANALHGGRLSLIDSIRLAFHTLMSNAAGASVGMEAAYSQIGAGLLSAVGQWLRLRRKDLRMFVSAGAAAAIAAAFNAPMAGAFYAYELILGGYNPAALAQVAVAALSGTLAAHWLGGGMPLLRITMPAAAHAIELYPLFALLGIGAAGVGIGTMTATTRWEKRLRRLRTPDWLRPTIGGVGLSLLAFVFPEVLGSGQGAIQNLLQTPRAFLPVILLLAAKMVASAVSIGAGFRGGLFSSSLMLGCLYGAAMGKVLMPLFPGIAADQTIFLLVGMGAVGASIVGAPLTMVMLVLEITGDAQATLGVLVGVVVAATITRHSFGYSFATWRFHQRGKIIRGAHDVGWVSALTVARLLHHDGTIVRRDTPLLHLRDMLPLDSKHHVFAVDEDGCYTGMIDGIAAHDVDLDAAAPALVAADLTIAASHFLLPGQDVRSALSAFRRAKTETLPVLSSVEDRQVIGYVTEAGLLKRIVSELSRQRSSELGEPDLFEIAPIQ